MVNDKEEVKKSLNRWLIQTAREQECKDDEVALVAYNLLADIIYLNRH